MPNQFDLPNLGLGVGLRSVHFPYILKNKPVVDWFEVISENFIDSHGRPRMVLDEIAAYYPVVMHGVSLSIGSTDPLNFDYLAKLKNLQKKSKPFGFPITFAGLAFAGVNTHDLLPVVLNEESLTHVTERIKQVQNFLERPLILENPSSYVTFAQSTIPEWEFLIRMSESTGCGLLLDVNNVYVSCMNHDLDPNEYVDAIPAEKIVQCHLAGHTNCGTHLIDTHDQSVIEPVWNLYSKLHQKTGGVSTLLEWDAHIPSFEDVHAEVLRARQFQSERPITFDDASVESKAGTQQTSVPQPAHTIPVEVE